MQISSLVGNRPNNIGTHGIVYEYYLACFLIIANLDKPNLHYLHEMTPNISQLLRNMSNVTQKQVLKLLLLSCKKKGLASFRARYGDNA